MSDIRICTVRRRRMCELVHRDFSWLASSVERERERERETESDRNASHPVRSYITPLCRAVPNLTYECALDERRTSEREPDETKGYSGGGRTGVSTGAENDREQRKRKQKRRGVIRSMATLPVRSPHTMHSLVLTSVSRSLLAARHLPHYPCISRASYLTYPLGERYPSPRKFRDSDM